MRTIMVIQNRYSYGQIGKHFGVHFTTVGRIVGAGRKIRKQAGEKQG